MCVSKLSTKTLDKIVKDALAIEVGSAIAEVRHYEAKRYKVQSYDLDGT